MHHQWEHYWCHSYYIYLLESKSIRYISISLLTHSTSLDYIYHTIFTIFELLWYNYVYGIKKKLEPCIPVPYWYLLMVIPTQHWYRHKIHYITYLPIYIVVIVVVEVKDLFLYYTHTINLRCFYRSLTTL